jgi:hypothetical protein
MHTKFILVNCEQATVALTGDLEKMGNRHDVTHKVLLVKCEEVPGDLKNNMGNVYMWPSEFFFMKSVNSVALYKSHQSISD